MRRGLIIRNKWAKNKGRQVVQLEDWDWKVEAITTAEGCVIKLLQKLRTNYDFGGYTYTNLGGTPQIVLHR